MTTLTVKAGALHVYVTNRNINGSVPRLDIAPIDTSSVHATIDTKTMVLTLKYDKSYDVSNINVYKDGFIVNSLCQTVYAGEYLHIDLSQGGCGDYYVYIVNGNEISE